jgi:hypothetical protein
MNRRHIDLCRPFPQSPPNTWIRLLRCAAATLLLNTCAGASTAQDTKKAAPPAVAAAMITRVEQFLREVARLSLMPPGTDPNHDQQWPRADYYEVPAPDGATTQRYKRLQTTRVTAHHLWNDPARGPAWTVELYGGAIEATVLVQTGAIVVFLDGALGNTLAHDPAPELSQCLSGDVALSRATQYLRAAGLNLNELVLRSVSLADMGRPPMAVERCWDITWDRVWHGVPYDDQSIHMSLDAGRGRLISYGAAVGAPSPAVARLDVSTVGAVEIARRFIVAHSAEPAGEPIRPYQE